MKSAECRVENGEWRLRAKGRELRAEGEMGAMGQEWGRRVGIKCDIMKLARPVASARPARGSWSLWLAGCWLACWPLAVGRGQAQRAKYEQQRRQWKQQQQQHHETQLPSRRQTSRAGRPTKIGVAPAAGRLRAGWTASKLAFVCLF